MWLLFSILAGFFFATLSVVERYLLKSSESDPLAFSFFFSFTSALLLIPVIFFSPDFSSSVLSWILVICVSALLCAHNFLNFTAIKHVSVSIVGTVGKFKVIWVLLLGLLFAYEAWSTYKGIGILLTVMAGTILVAKLDENSFLKGIIYAFIATFFGALAIVVYTPLLAEFNVLSLTFLIFAFPAFINFLAMKNPIKRIKKQYHQHSWRFLIIGILGVLANIAVVAAINIGEASRVLVIVEAMFIIVLFAESLILKEKTQLVRKSIAVTFATIGAILIRIIP